MRDRLAPAAVERTGKFRTENSHLLLPKVKRRGIVHGKLDAEAAGVLDEEQPSVEVEGSRAEGVGSRHLSHGAVLLHILVVTLGGVIGDEKDGDSNS